jgi:GNAT superfamily N-acetyltransferase
MQSDGELAEVVRVERTWALDAVAFATVLADQDTSWGTESFELSGGRVVLCGRGLYINRALAVGLDAPLSPVELARLETRSAAVGVPASVEIGPATRPEVAVELRDRGYEVDGAVHTFRYRLDEHDDRVDLGDADRGLLISIVRADEALLPMWQQTAALGWGHAAAEARRASDAFARAAAVVDGAGFVVARAVGDGRALGCATLSIRDGIATLGGLSTVPAERRRGVQTALIHQRLRAAKAAGCELATSTAMPDSPSARNLMRCGFDHWYTKYTFVRPDPAR